MKKNPYDQFFTKAQAVKRGHKPVSRPALVHKTSNRPPLPWKAVLGLALSLVTAVSYLFFPAFFEHILDRIEIGAFGAAMASDKEAGAKASHAPAEKSKPEHAKAEKSAAGETTGVKTKDSEEKTAVEEDFSHFEKLKQRKEELDAREKELTELEEELQKQKVELDKRIVQLEEMRGQIGKTLKDRVEVDQEKVNKLVDLYSNMKSKQAADVIGTINEELAVEVLSKMKKKNAAEIMNLLAPEKARVLSEKFTGYRRISSQEPKG